MHYHRVRRLGSPGPVGPLTNKLLPPEERFWQSFDQDDETGCWVWRHPGQDGYGQLKVQGVNTRAHRFGYELLVGPIPHGLDIDHLCRTPRCVNPGHLEPVTIRENLMRGETVAARNARKTHCPRGHPLSGDNLLPAHVKRGARACKLCAAINRKSRAEARKKR